MGYPIHSANNLYGELGTVTDTNQVISHPNQIKHHNGTEAECQRAAFTADITKKLTVPQQHIESQSKCHREKDNRFEGYPS